MKRFQLRIYSIKLLFGLVTFFFVSVSLAQVTYEIEPGLSFKETDLRNVKKEVQQMERYFDIPFNDLHIMVTNNCFRTGYSYKEKTIQFCDQVSTIFAGLQSLDVIRHELFHAFICQEYPFLCTSEIMKKANVKAIHEALADWYTSLFDRTPHFGEHFYTDKKFVRSYQNDYCFDLVIGEHLKGNSILSGLLAKNFSFLAILNSIKSEKQFMDLIELSKKKSCLGHTEFEFIPEQIKKSKLNRYRLNRNEELHFELPFYGLENLRLKYHYPKEIISVRTSGDKVIVKGLQKGISKVSVQLFDSGRLIGIQSLYFRVR
ncbi:hypothetical protein HBN50_10855 [Halobacteriovorax sp. GB3]|uniref:hypothetical protein n=1 Tax=Halobacteriovorax sp. GB3 TaxID=2719615 RepID=UPI00236245F9|nr:hypothetical protein [Halobacteriovorax sp. GB3]MDD0853602.1 hypothetical protein [Halobacteriovorax sp. GB3]